MRKKVIVTLLSIVGIIILSGVGVIYYFFSTSATGYHKDGSKVIYRVSGISTDEIPGADAKTFKVMDIGGGQLGQDKHRIYLLQSAFPADLDQASFQLLPDNSNWTRFFARDKNRAYYGVNVLETADPNSLIILEDGFSKDAKSVFFQDKRLDGVDPSTFKTLGSYYATDGQSVYYSEHKIPGVDIATFKVPSEDENYARDKNNLYRFEVPGQVVNEEFIPNKE